MRIRPEAGGSCLAGGSTTNLFIEKHCRKLGKPFSRYHLIVIGTQGLSGFRKLFFGSTTEQILRRVAIPVLAIPPSKRSRSTGAHPMRVGKVIAPLDLTGEWQSDAIRAAKVATAFGAELLLVHVLDPSRRHRGSSRRRE